TGLGAVTPLGNDVESTWEGLVAGRSGAANITQFDSSDYAVHFACEVKGFDPTEYIDRKQARRLDRFAPRIVAPPRPSRGRLGDLDRIRVRPRGRGHRHRDRRSQGLPGLPQRAALPRPRPG